MGNEMYLMQPGLKKKKKKVFFSHREMTSTCCRVEATVAWIEVTMRDCHSSALLWVWTTSMQSHKCQSLFIDTVCERLCVRVHVCACVRECVQFNHICYGLCVHSLVCTSVLVSQWPVRTLLHTRGWVSMLPSVTTSKGWEPRCCLFSFLSFFCSFFLLSDSVSKITDRNTVMGLYSWCSSTLLLEYSLMCLHPERQKNIYFHLLGPRLKLCCLPSAWLMILCATLLARSMLQHAELSLVWLLFFSFFLLLFLPFFFSFLGGDSRCSSSSFLFFSVMWKKK